MNIISLNVRGIGGSGKSTTIHNLILDGDPALMGLVETKHSSVNSSLVRIWWDHDEFN